MRIEKRSRDGRNSVLLTKSWKGVYCVVVSCYDDHNAIPNREVFTSFCDAETYYNNTPIPSRVYSRFGEFKGEKWEEFKKWRRSDGRSMSFELLVDAWVNGVPPGWRRDEGK